MQAERRYVHVNKFVRCGPGLLLLLGKYLSCPSCGTCLCAYKAQMPVMARPPVWPPWHAMADSQNCPLTRIFMVHTEILEQRRFKSKRQRHEVQMSNFWVALKELNLIFKLPYYGYRINSMVYGFWQFNLNSLTATQISGGAHQTTYHGRSRQSGSLIWRMVIPCR